LPITRKDQQEKIRPERFVENEKKGGLGRKSALLGEVGVAALEVGFAAGVAGEFLQRAFGEDLGDEEGEEAADEGGGGEEQDGAGRGAWGGRVHGGRGNLIQVRGQCQKK
jgi:hypothetical protein